MPLPFRNTTSNTGNHNSNNNNRRNPPGNNNRSEGGGRFFDGLFKTLGEWKDSVMTGLEGLIEQLKEQINKLVKAFSFFRYTKYANL